MLRTDALLLPSEKDEEQRRNKLQQSSFPQMLQLLLQIFNRRIIPITVFVLFEHDLEKFLNHLEPLRAESGDV